MSPKAIRVGGEIDSYCTRCRLILNHRIVSILDGKPAKVICLTCTNAEARMYRPYPPGQKPPPAGAGRSAPAAAPARAGSSSSSSGGSAGPRTTRAAAAAARELQERNDRERFWEKSIAGKAMGDFKPYRISSTFQEGDLVRHSRFGDGVVMKVVDPRKIEVLFKEDSKVLAHGMVEAAG